MPHLDASALIADPEGTDFLRRVLVSDDHAVAPTKSAFVPTHAPTPTSPLLRELPITRPLLAIADAA